MQGAGLAGAAFDLGAAHLRWLAGFGRPDLVTAVPWHEGRHTKEWNTDPERWERSVAEFTAG